MLYVFHGSLIKESLRKAHALIDSLRKKKPDAAFEKMSAEDWNPSVLEGHLGGQGLFSNKYIIFLDRLTENTEAKVQLPEFIPAMNESPNIFILVEGKVLIDLKKGFEKHAEKVVASEEAASKFGKKKDFNVFELADAVGMRDPMKAWSIYRQAIDNGLEAESILGTLFWQVKSMILAAPAKSAAEAGLSPFVYSKAKRYVGNYSASELSSLASDLIALYHDGHRGIRDMELATEQIVLAVGKK